MKSVMTHAFSRVPQVDIPRSVFNRAHTHKTTFDAGKLIPFYIDEVLPGDTFNVKATLFGRLATPIKPVMDNIKLDTHYFFVAKRKLWDNFQKFMGEQDKPGDSTDFTVPQITCKRGSQLTDYFGLPLPSQNAQYDVACWWHRAYNQIWNQWYRDENLQDPAYNYTEDASRIDELAGTVNSSGDSIAYDILPRGKRHDYFTSALPWPQKGNAISVPIGTTAPIVSTGTLQLTTDGGTTSAGLRKASGATSTARWGDDYADISDSIEASYKSGLQADLTNAQATTINSLRTAFQLQRLAEKDARGGTRYTEIIKSHFNVTSPDARLQRPEYLGGSTCDLNMATVPQTSNTIAGSSITPQGNLSAYGTFSTDRDGFSKSFTEHGVIIGLVSARSDLTYSQGINRMFSRRTKDDFYFPVLAHLGEQAVLNKEIYSDGSANDDGVFGYQERWAEYRYANSKITGKMRSNATGSLDIWHLSEDFANLPTLSAQFIEEPTSTIDRVIAVPSEPQFILDSYIDVKTARAMPTYSVPGLIDHF